MKCKYEGLCKGGSEENLCYTGHTGALCESCDILNTQSKQNLLIFRIRILFSLIKICLWQM